MDTIEPPHTPEGLLISFAIVAVLMVPFFFQHYGRGGRQKCYNRRDIGDFIAYAVSTGTKEFIVEEVK